MEIVQSCEAFVERDDDFVFSHTKIILKTKAGRYFYATTDQRDSSASELDLSNLSLIEIPPDNVWPKYHGKLTRATEPLPLNCYVKEPTLLYYGDTEASRNLGALILNEAEVCEVLKRSPHPNIAEYLGCLVEGDRIKGLCFRKYQSTLYERMKQPDRVNVEHCLNGINKGVKHLHSLGLIHNDLKPDNIMIDQDEPVIIDFDSCANEGDTLGPKVGTHGWAIKGMTRARRENDFYAIQQIEKSLGRGTAQEVVKDAFSDDLPTEETP